LRRPRTVALPGRVVARRAAILRKPSDPVSARRVFGVAFAADWARRLENAHSHLKFVLGQVKLARLLRGRD